MSINIKKYHYLCFLLLWMALGNGIAQNNQSYVNSTLRARSWNNNPVVLSNEIKGGIHYVSNNGDEANIPTARLQAGMLVAVGTINWDGNDIVKQWTGAEWVQVTLLRVFETGANYVSGQVVLQGAKLYIARNNLNNASSNPSADATNWMDLQAHLSNDEIHRTINDAGVANTDLWSANRIITYVGTQSQAAEGDGLIWDNVNSEIDVNVDNSTIEINSDKLRIKDGGVTNAKIWDEAVTEDKLADDAVTSDKILDETIVTDDIADDAVTLGDQTTGNYVEEIVAGNGLTGDVAAEAATATLAVGAGDGISVNADNVAVNAGNGLSFDAGALRITPGTTGQVLTTNTAENGVQWTSFNLNSTHVEFRNVATVNLLDEHQGVILCTSAVNTVNLPNAVGNNGMMFKIKNIGTSNIVIDANASTRIDGDLQTALPTMNASVTVVSFNGNWYITDRQAKNEIYIGNPNTDDSWRIRISATGLKFEQKSGSSWIEKIEIEE